MRKDEIIPIFYFYLTLVFDIFTLVIRYSNIIYFGTRTQTMNSLIIRPDFSEKRRLDTSSTGAERGWHT